jgi:hypothetical protein
LDPEQGLSSRDEADRGAGEAWGVSSEEGVTLDFSRCRLAPFQHQREDVQAVIDHPYFFVASEMRTGKSKIIVDAAQFLFEAGVIDKVIVVSPAPVRDVWYDEQIGEIAKHAWLDLPIKVSEFHARCRQWLNDAPGVRRLQWAVTNFEFLRSKNRLIQLLPFCNQKTLLVLDESSFVKNHAAEQTKACLQLRRACGRVVLLNGTPLFHSPLDLFSQGNILHESIIGTKYVTHFKARYAIQGPVLRNGGSPMVNAWGRPIMKVNGWTNLDDLQRRFAPVTVRRLQKDCLDLPPKLDPVTLTTTLTPETWKAYKDMREEMVVWLSSNDVATSATAAIKALRLSQITGGFIGGVEDSGIDVQYPDWPPTNRSVDPIREIGHEKLDVLLWFIEQRLAEDENLHLVAWGRFRAEVLRAEAEVKVKFPQFETATIMGGQKKAERLRALALLKPETSPTGPVFVAGIEGTGSFGLDMCAAHTCVTMSSGYSPGRSAQTLDRVYGPGQKFPIAYYDIIAVGPKGQHTIDRDILLTRRNGEDIAQRTAAGWVKALKDE